VGLGGPRWNSWKFGVSHRQAMQCMRDHELQSCSHCTSGNPNNTKVDVFETWCSSSKCMPNKQNSINFLPMAFCLQGFFSQEAFHPENIHQYHLQQQWQYSHHCHTTIKLDFSPYFMATRNRHPVQSNMTKYKSTGETAWIINKSNA